jgi:hypothetical protein
MMEFVVNFFHNSMILVQLIAKILRLAILASLHLPVIFKLNLKMINTFKTFRNIIIGNKINQYVNNFVILTFFSFYLFIRLKL